MVYNDQPRPLSKQIVASPHCIQLEVLDKFEDPAIPAHSKRLFASTNRGPSYDANPMQLEYIDHVISRIHDWCLQQTYKQMAISSSLKAPFLISLCEVEA